MFKPGRPTLPALTPLLAATLAVTGANHLLAAEPAAPCLAVLCRAENRLALIDPVTLKVQARIPTGADPHEVAVSADGRMAIVANYGGQQPGATLSVIDISSRKEIKRVDLGPLRRPHGIVEREGKFYFTAEANSLVARFDPVSEKVDWMFGTGEIGTHTLVITQDGEKIYTANVLSHSVTAIDLAHPLGARSKRISVGKSPEGIAISPDGREVWVGQGGGGLSIIDTATDTILDTIETPDACLRLLFTRDGKRLLAPDTRTGSLVIYDTATRKETARIPIGMTPVGLTLDESGKRAFISAMGDDWVAVVDLEQVKSLGGFSPGPEPDGIAWAGPQPAPLVVAKRRGALGVALAPLPAAQREALKIEGGAVVQGITPGSAAEAAGLLAGDIVLTVNGTSIAAPETLVTAVARSFAGDTLILEVRRGGAAIKLTAALKPRT